MRDNENLTHFNRMLHALCPVNYSWGWIGVYYKFDQKEIILEGVITNPKWFIEFGKLMMITGREYEIRQFYYKDKIKQIRNYEKYNKLYPMGTIYPVADYIFATPVQNHVFDTAFKAGALDAEKKAIFSAKVIAVGPLVKNVSEGHFIKVNNRPGVLIETELGLLVSIREREVTTGSKSEQNDQL